MRTLRRHLVPVVAALALVGATGAEAAPRTAAASPAVTYFVPAGQTGHESRPTLTGAGRYSYLHPTMDRAASSNLPNRATLKGEAYLGDGGATASYTIKKLAPTPVALTLWINYSDDGRHRSGTRDVDVSIPQLRWSSHWSHQSLDTRGWKAVKVGTVRTAGNITIRFRKSATTPAAFTLNALALTSSTTPPNFGPPPAAVTYLVPAGQTGHESRPTLTGAGRYTYLNATMDRAASNNQPNRANLKGEAYLGDGGATASYTIKKLAPAAVPMTLWIHHSDDGRHPNGTRDVDISIPQLNWSTRWAHRSVDTKGWQAVKVGTVTTAGNITIRFRKSATTSAAFTLNAFALTTSSAVPPFGFTYRPLDGAWSGSFQGTVGGQPAAGGVAATVAGSVIKVTAPITGTGTVNDKGELQVTGALRAFGLTCTYRGVLVATTTPPSVRSGTWSCTGPLIGSGTWTASRR